MHCLIAKNEELCNQVKNLTADKTWLIREGFRHVVDQLHLGSEYRSPIEDIQQSAHTYGLHNGLRAGYKCASQQKDMESGVYYLPKARDALTVAVKAFKNAQFPYLDAVAWCIDQPLSVLQAVRPLSIEKNISPSPSSKANLATFSEPVTGAFSDVLTRSPGSVLSKFQVGFSEGASLVNPFKIANSSDAHLAEGKTVTNPSVHAEDVVKDANQGDVIQNVDACSGHIPAVQDIGAV